MKNNLQILIDFLIDFKFNKNDIDKISTEVEKVLKDISPDIKFDIEDFKKNLSLVENEFEGIEQVANIISKSLEDINLDNFIEDINKTGEIIDQMGEAMNDVNFDNIDVDKLNDAFENLDPGKAFEGLDENLKKSNLNVSQITDKMEALAKEGKKNTDEYKAWEKQLKLAKVEADATGKAMETISKEADNAGSFIDKMASFGLAAQGINTIASGMQDLAQPFVALDTATQNLKTLGDEAAEMAPNLREAAITMSSDLPFAAAELQTTMFDALASGVKGGEEGLKSFADTAAKLAVGGASSISESTNLLAGQLNAYGKSAEDAAKFSDIFFNTVNYGVTSIPELSASLSNVIPTASQLGIELEAVGAGLANMTSKGIPTAQSTTKLNALFSELAKPGATLAPILEKAGVSLESLNREDLPVTLSKINTALKESGKASIEVFSSSEAGAAFATLAGDLDGFAKTFEDVKNTTGSAQNAYEQMADSIEVRTKQIQTKVESLLIGGFDKLGNSFTVIAQASAQLAPTVTTMVGLGQALPIDRMKQFGNEALKTAKNFSTLNGAKLNFAAAQTGIKGLTANLSKLGPLLMNPWVIAGAGIALFLTQTEQGQELLQKLGDKGEALLEKLAPIGEVLLDIISIGVEGGINYVMQFIDTLGSVFGLIEDLASLILSLIPGFGGLGSSIEGTVSILDVVKDKFKSLVDFLALVPLGLQVIVEGLRGLVQNAPAIVDAFSDYLKVKLSPSSWFGEDGEAEKQAEAKLSKVLSNAMNGAKGTITNFKLGKTLEESLEIKGDLDKQNKIGDLIKEYEKTTDEVKKNDLAKLITENFPTAISGYKQIIDANGNVVEAIDLNIDKAKELNEEQKKNGNTEFLKNQKEFTNVLKEQAVQYSENKQRAVELANEIVEKSKKGIDTSNLEREYKNVQKSLKEQTEKFKTELSEANKLGFQISDVELPKEFKTNFADQLSKVVKSPDIINATKGLDDLLTLNGKVDKEDRLNELVTKFKSAKDVVAKESIAEEIRRSVPGAVEAVGTIVDENGKLVTTYEVAGEKVKAFTEETKKSVDSEILKKKEEINKAILSEIDAYDKVKNDVVAKQKEISEAKSKGLDTSKLEEEYKALKTQSNAMGEDLIKTIAKSKTQGIATEQQFEKLAKALGKSPAEAKKLVDLQVTSIAKSKEQVRSVDDLAKAYESATTELDKNIKNQTAALTKLALEKADPKLSKEQREDAKKQYNELLKSTKDYVKQKKEIEKTGDKVLIASNQKDVEDTRLAKAKELLTTKTQELDLSLSTLKVAQDEIAVKEDRKRDDVDEYNIQLQTLKNLKEQKDAWVNILKEKNLVKNIKADGTIEYNGKIKPADKSEIEKSIADYNLKIREESINLDELRVKVNLDNIELEKQFKELQKTQIDYEIEIGVRAKGDYTEIIKSLKNEQSKLETEFKASNDKLAKLDLSLREEISKATTKEEIESIQLRFQTKINAEKKNNIEFQKQLMDNSKELLDYETKSYTERLEELNNYYDSKLTLISERNSKELEQLSVLIGTSNQILNSKYDSELDEQNSILDSKLNEKMSLIEKQKELEIISQYTFENRKLQIEEEALKRKEELEEEYRKKKLVADSVARGLEIEAKRRADEQVLTLEKEKLNKELELLRDKNNLSAIDFNSIIDLQKENKRLELELIQNANDLALQQQKKQTEALLKEKIKETGFNNNDTGNLEKLSTQLDETEKILKTKSEDINLLAIGLQESVTGSMENLFNGDPQAAVDNWRQYFSQLAGMLQRKLSGFVLDLLLSPGVINTIGSIPFPFNIAAMGAAKLGIDSAVRAISNPIINNILSFPTGGVFTEPTLAMVGDGSRLGMQNREWLLNDPQLIGTVRMATEMSSKDTIREIRGLRQDFSNMRIETSIEIDRLRIALKKSENNAKLRER